MPRRKKKTEILLSVTIKGQGRKARKTMPKKKIIAALPTPQDRLRNALTAIDPYHACTAKGVTLGQGIFSGLVTAFQSVYSEDVEATIKRLVPFMPSQIRKAAIPPGLRELVLKARNGQ